MSRPLMRLALVAVLVLSAGGAYWLRTAVAGRPPGPATLDCPERLVTGEAEAGELLVTRFSIRNTGDRELVIDQIEACCGCAGIEREQPDGFQLVSEIRIAPGEACPLAIRRGVPHAVGLAFESSISFRTNSPDHPRHTVHVRIPKILGGVETTPGHIVLGSIQRGSRVVRVVEVADAMPGRTLDRILSSDPKRIRLRDSRPEGQATSCLAKIEIDVDTLTVGPVNGSVAVYVRGRTRPTVIPVTGLVVDAAEIVPATVVLPRRSETGLMYEATCQVRSATGEEINLAGLLGPSYLTVEQRPDPANPTVKTIVVRLDPKFKTGGVSVTERITIEATVAGKRVPLELRVRYDSEVSP